MKRFDPKHDKAHFIDEKRVYYHFFTRNTEGGTMNQPLIFTVNAASKVWELMEEEGNFNLKLRVYVTGGGCSGFQYGFTFDEVKNEDDAVMEKNGVMLLIDPMSYQYLVG